MENLKEMTLEQFDKEEAFKFFFGWQIKFVRRGDSLFVKDWCHSTTVPLSWGIVTGEVVEVESEIDYNESGARFDSILLKIVPNSSFCVESSQEFADLRWDGKTISITRKGYIDLKGEKIAD